MKIFCKHQWSEWKSFTSPYKVMVKKSGGGEAGSEIWEEEYTEIRVKVKSVCSLCGKEKIKEIQV